MRLIPQIDLSWPPANVDIAIQGFNKWSLTTNVVSFTTRIDVGIESLLKEIYSSLPSHVLIIPFFKLTSGKIDEVSTWELILNKINSLNKRCSECGRAKNTIIGLDIEDITRNPIVLNTETLNLRNIYYQCVTLLSNSIDEIWIHPSIYDHPSDYGGVRYRSTSLCRSIEFGIKTLTPRIKWITQRVQDKQAVGDHYKQDCFIELKRFCNFNPIAKLYFYKEPIEQWYQPNEINLALSNVKLFDMNDCIIYPGIDNWLNASENIVNQLIIS